MTAENDIEAFRLMVRRLILAGSPIRIDNGSAEHAKVILEEMFRHAQKTAFVACLSEPEHVTNLNVNFIFKDAFSLNILHLICSPGLNSPVGSGKWEGPGAYLSHSKITTAGFSHLPTGVSLMLLVEGLS